MACLVVVTINGGIMDALGYCQAVVCHFFRFVRFEHARCHSGGGKVERFRNDLLLGFLVTGSHGRFSNGCGECRRLAQRGG